MKFAIHIIVFILMGLGLKAEQIVQLVQPTYKQEKVTRNGTQFEWTPVENADYYEIMIAGHRSFTYDTDLYRTNLVVFNCPKELDYCRNYYWKVRAVFVNAFDTTFGAWSQVGEFRSVAKLSAPELSSPLDKSEFTTNDSDYWFSWRGGESDNYFAFSTDSNMYDVAGTSIYTKNYHNFSKRLKAGTYYWRVQTGQVDNPYSQNPQYFFSDWSETRCIIVKEAQIAYINPVYPIGYDRVPLDITIRWTSVPNAINYEFELNTVSTNS